MVVHTKAFTISAENWRGRGAATLNKFRLAKSTTDSFAAFLFCKSNSSNFDKTKLRDQCLLLSKTSNGDQISLHSIAQKGASKRSRGRDLKNVFGGKPSQTPNFPIPFERFHGYSLSTTFFFRALIMSCTLVFMSLSTPPILVKKFKESATARNLQA